MKRYAILILSFAAAAVLSACRQDEPVYIEPDTMLGVKASSLVYQPDGGTGTITLDTDQPLTAESVQPWCKTSVSGNVVTVTADPYSGLETRYSTVTVRSGDKSVSLVAHQYGVIVRSFDFGDISTGNAAFEKEFTFDANTSRLEVTSDSEWVTTEVEGNKLTVKVAENASMDFREAVLTWKIGEMTDHFSVIQFDAVDAGLLGSWKWHGGNAATSRHTDFPMDATFAREDDGSFSLALNVSSRTYVIDLKIPDVQFAGKTVSVPLGGQIGTYTIVKTGAGYYVYLLVADGAAAVKYNDAVHEGRFIFNLSRDEGGKWHATAANPDFADKTLRLEMWTSENHLGSSDSQLALLDVYLDQQ